MERFIRAQEGEYTKALAELRAGRKRTHWVRYVMPQLRSLGRSQVAREYGIANLEEAIAYSAHPVLGPRLVECVNAILNRPDRSAQEILGDIDAMKFLSCLTLFARAVPEEPAFAEALRKFFQGKPDELTLRYLELDTAKNRAPTLFHGLKDEEQDAHKDRDTYFSSGQSRKLDHSLSSPPNVGGADAAVRVS